MEDECVQRWGTVERSSSSRDTDRFEVIVGRVVFYHRQLCVHEREKESITLGVAEACRAHRLHVAKELVRPEHLELHGRMVGQ